MTNDIRLTIEGQGSAQGAPEIPPFPGRLMTAEDVASEIFNNTVTSKWVTRHLDAGKVKLGHIKRVWHEQTVREWLEAKLKEVA